MRRLLQMLGYNGMAEGHYFVLLSRIRKVFGEQDRRIRTYKYPTPCTTWHNFDASAVLAGIKQSFVAEMDRLFQGQPWCDKTPGGEMIETAHELLQLYPNAFFIFMKRRGIENIKSQMVKFGTDFDTCCKVWAKCMKSWWVNRQNLGRRYLEIEQHDLRSNPETVIAEILRCLQIDPSLTQRIAKWYRHREQIDSAPPPLVGVHQTGWSAIEKRKFLQLCGPTMRAYGYPIDFSPDSRFDLEDWALPESFRPENILTPWFDIPYSPLDPFKAYPNPPASPPAAVTFFGLPKGSSVKAVLRAVLDGTCPLTVRLSLLVRASASGMGSAWQQNDYYLKPGPQELELQVPPAERLDLRFEIDVPPDSTDFRNCGVMINRLRFIKKPVTG